MTTGKGIKGKGKGNEAQKGGQPQAKPPAKGGIRGACKGPYFTCGKIGHRAADCRARQADAVEEEQAAEEDEDIFTGGSLRNTRKAYECENLGEAQAFQDDLFYLMEGLKSKYKLSERCLCAIKLAEQCLSSEFRMSLRSSSSVDYVNKIFKILNDSNKFKVSNF